MAIVQQPTQPTTFTQDSDYHSHPHTSTPISNGSTTSSPTSAKARKPAKSKKQLSPEEVNSMINNKINQLEEVSVKEEEEEIALAEAVKTANKEMLSVIHSDEVDKLNILHQRYMDLFQNMKKLERDHARMKKQHELLRKERDTTKSEFVKTTTLKSKLEQLCRELQKENKRIKEESVKLAEKEQQKREELSAKFEQTIWEIKNKMEEDGDEKRKRVEDNELMKQKFASFLEQYDLREKHFGCILKSKDLELQLSAAKLSQAQEQQASAVAAASQENAAFREQNEQLHEKIRIFERTEQELRKQVGVYVEKFRQVEETLNKSNELFLTFRGEMEQMTKKTKKLEKENAAIKTKCDTMNKNILEMAEERTAHTKTLETLTKKSQKLENLCRALQAERDELKKRLETYKNKNQDGNSGDPKYSIKDEQGNVRSRHVSEDNGESDV